ncbi:hypothetical protein [Sphingomonas sp.]|uniref:hypothetical protein n=1 Tax=Sphingomonas sp. TaxID=28214 RepID=UPI0033415FCC
MLFTTPEQFIVLGVLLLGGWLLGYASAPSTKKWKRRVREQSDSFTAYHAEAEDRARAANQRASDLQGELEAARADHAEAERTIVGLRAAAAAAAVPIAAAVAEGPALSLVKPEPTREIVAEPAPVEVAPMTEADTAPLAVEPIPEPAPAAAVIAVPDHADAVEAETSAPEAAAATAAEPPEPEPTIEDAVFEPVEPVPMTPTATAAPPAPIGPAEPEMPSKGWFASSARDELTRIRGIDEALNTRLFELGVVRFEDIEMLSAEDEMALEERLALPAGTIARDQWRAQAAFFRAGRSNEDAAHAAPVEPAPVA